MTAPWYKWDPRQAARRWHMDRSGHRPRWSLRPWYPSSRIVRLIRRYLLRQNYCLDCHGWYSRRHFEA